MFLFWFLISFSLYANKGLLPSHTLEVSYDTSDSYDSSSDDEIGNLPPKILTRSEIFKHFKNTMPNKAEASKIIRKRPDAFASLIAPVTESTEQHLFNTLLKSSNKLVARNIGTLALYVLSKQQTVFTPDQISFLNQHCSKQVLKKVCSQIQRHITSLSPEKLQIFTASVWNRHSYLRSYTDECEQQLDIKEIITGISWGHEITSQRRHLVKSIFRLNQEHNKNVPPDNLFHSGQGICGAILNGLTREQITQLPYLPPLFDETLSCLNGRTLLETHEEEIAPRYNTVVALAHFMGNAFFTYQKNRGYRFSISTCYKSSTFFGDIVRYPFRDNVRTGKYLEFLTILKGLQPLSEDNPIVRVKKPYTYVAHPSLPPSLVEILLPISWSQVIDRLPLEEVMSNVFLPLTYKCYELEKDHSCNKDTNPSIQDAHICLDAIFTCIRTHYTKETVPALVKYTLSVAHANTLPYSSLFHDKIHDFLNSFLGEKLSY